MNTITRFYHRHARVGSAYLIRSFFHRWAVERDHSDYDGYGAGFRLGLLYLGEESLHYSPSEWFILFGNFTLLRGDSLAVPGWVRKFYTTRKRIKVVVPFAWHLLRHTNSAVQLRALVPACRMIWSITH